MKAQKEWRKRIWIGREKKEEGEETRETKKEKYEDFKTASEF